MLVGCAVLCAAGGVALTSVLSAKPASPGGVVIQAQPTLLRYQIPGDVTKDGDEREGANFAVVGDASKDLYPGTTSSVDLSFTNETDEAIDLPPGTLKITISTPRAGCPASPNFSVVRTITTTIVIPKSATDASLADLHVTPRFWPVVSMVTTHTTQDACAGMAITLHYSAGSGDHGD
jgi:hypothetical protein